MISSSLIRVALVLCTLALASACTSRAPALRPRGTLPIALSAEKKSSAVTARLFNLLTVTLPTPKEPGYTWQIAFHDARYLKQTTEILPPTTRGAGPTVSFIAQNPGRSRLRFLLVPDGAARIADPVDQQEVVITIESGS